MKTNDQHIPPYPLLPFPCKFSPFWTQQRLFPLKTASCAIDLFLLSVMSLNFPLWNIIDYIGSTFKNKKTFFSKSVSVVCLLMLFSLNNQENTCLKSLLTLETEACPFLGRQMKPSI